MTLTLEEISAQIEQNKTDKLVQKANRLFMEWQHRKELANTVHRIQELVRVYANSNDTWSLTEEITPLAKRITELHKLIKTVEATD